jgi:hypothetical protein
MLMAFTVFSPLESIMKGEVYVVESFVGSDPSKV